MRRRAQRALQMMNGVIVVVIICLGTVTATVLKRDEKNRRPGRWAFNICPIAGGTLCGIRLGNAMRCIVLHCFLLHCIVLYCIILYCIELHYIVLYYIVFYCILMYYIAIVLHCIVQHCITLYCFASYCIALYCNGCCFVFHCIVFWCIESQTYCFIIIIFVFQISGCQTAP